MRVIAGSLKGRVFDSPHSHRTHPMSDRIRGALFNALGPIGGLTFLDAYAGSGALGIEAISRGASNAICIDIDQTAAETIARNIDALGISTFVKSVQANVQGWSQKNPGQQFDVVMCDPPYDQFSELSIQRLCRHVLPGGLMVLSLPGELALPSLEGLQLVAHKTYGDAQLAFYRK